QSAVVGDRLVVGDQDVDVGPDGQRRARGDREAAGEDVAEVRGVGADLAEAQRAGRLGTGVDVDVVEALVAAQVLHVVVGDIEGGVEDVAGQVAAVEHAAVVQVKLVEG